MRERYNLPELGSPELNQQQLELANESTLEIQRIALSAIRQLSDKPRVGINGAYPNMNKSYSLNNIIIHSIATETIAPLDYNAPKIQGLTDVTLDQLSVETDITRFRLFDNEIFSWPDRPLNRTACVKLVNHGPAGEITNNYWYGSGFFKASTLGRVTTHNPSSSPAKDLAAAALVGQVVNQAQYTNIHLGNAANLYADWQQIDRYTPEPTDPKYIWSIYDCGDV